MTDADHSLRVLIGELNECTDIQTAAIVAEMHLDDALKHASAWSRGEYSEAEPIQPSIMVVDDTIVITAPGFAANGLVLAIERWADIGEVRNDRD